jgi:hypothetical protein
MDPRFTPARRLQEKARNRDSDVDISELQAFAAGEAAFPGGAASPPPASPPRPTAVVAPPPRLTAVPPRPPAPRSTEKPDADRLLAEAGPVRRAGPRRRDRAREPGDGQKPGNPEAPRDRREGGRPEPPSRLVAGRANAMRPWTKEGCWTRAEVERHPRARRRPSGDANPEKRPRPRPPRKRRGRDSDFSPTRRTRPRCPHPSRGRLRGPRRGRHRTGDLRPGGLPSGVLHRDRRSG